MGDVTATMRLVISGRVQGVGYRAWCVQAARKLGLSGWVRNLAGGTVEVLAHGPAAAIENLVNACHIGPPLARVTAVDTTNVAVPEVISGGFKQLPTGAA